MADSGIIDIQMDVYPIKCPIEFEVLSCEEIAMRHKDCANPECLVCGFHEALMCSD